MIRNWDPLEGPQRAITRLRATTDGRSRSVFDLELPLMALLAVLVGLGIAMWLNGLGSPGAGEVRRVTERPALANPREALAAGAAKRAEATRVRARARRLQAARLARKRAAAATFVRRTDTRPGRGSSAQYPDGTTRSFSETNQTYTQQTLPSTPPPKQETSPAPRPKPAPKPSGGGGGGGGFDDSG